MFAFMVHATETGSSAFDPFDRPFLSVELMAKSSDDVVDAAWGAGIGVHALIWVRFFAIGLLSLRRVLPTSRSV